VPVFEQAKKKKSARGARQRCLPDLLSPPTPFFFFFFFF